MTRISIDLARRLGTVDRRIFGQFIEHLGRCIYGGVYDEGSPLADARGFRRDVLDAARPLRIPILRWPGGNFVSGYHWLDGVGPRDKRPRRSELAWYAEESNRFGTDEFIEYCRVLGAEPFICVNMGSGTMDEAQAWVEYCNGTGNTSWANLRRQHGHPDPYRVRYWGLGNEMYGGWQIGNMNAHDYVKKARAFAMVMKRTDPSIELIGCGQNGWSEWDEITLGGLAERIDNFAQLVNAIAPIFTNPKGLFVQTIYHPLRLYAEHTLAFGLDVHVEGETYELRPEQESPSGRVHHVADLGPFTLIDAAASCDEAGRAVSVALVNRDRDRDLPVTLDLGAAAIAGAVSGWEVNGPDVSATNSFETPRAVDVRERKLEARGSRLETVLAAHSVTVLRLEVRCIDERRGFPGALRA